MLKFVFFFYMRVVNIDTEGWGGRRGVCVVVKRFLFFFLPGKKSYDVISTQIWQSTLIDQVHIKPDVETRVELERLEGEREREPISSSHRILGEETKTDEEDGKKKKKKQTTWFNIRGAQQKRVLVVRGRGES